MPISPWQRIKEARKNIKIKVPFWLYWAQNVSIQTAICGTLNGTITYFMYKDKMDVMTLWGEIPNTIAGDVVVVIGLTVSITYMITVQRVLADCNKHNSESSPFYIYNRPTLESIPERLHPVVHRTHRRLFDFDGSNNRFRTFVHNLVYIGIPGVALTVSLELLLGMTFIAGGQLITKDVWTIQSLTIYKSVLGVLIGFCMSAPTVWLTGVELPPEEDQQEQDSAQGEIAEEEPLGDLNNITIDDRTNFSVPEEEIAEEAPLGDIANKAISNKKNESLTVVISPTSQDKWAKAINRYADSLTECNGPKVENNCV